MESTPHEAPHLLNSPRECPPHTYKVLLHFDYAELNDLLVARDKKTISDLDCTAHPICLRILSSSGPFEVHFKYGGVVDDQLSGQVLIVDYTLLEEVDIELEKGKPVANTPVTVHRHKSQIQDFSEKLNPSP
jgi:hypothetical protein